MGGQEWALVTLGPLHCICCVFHSGRLIFPLSLPSPFPIVVWPSFPSPTFTPFTFPPFVLFVDTFITFPWHCLVQPTLYPHVVVPLIPIPLSQPIQIVVMMTGDDIVIVGLIVSQWMVFLKSCDYYCIPIPFPANLPMLLSPLCPLEISWLFDELEGRWKSVVLLLSVKWWWWWRVVSQPMTIYLLIVAGSSHCVTYQWPRVVCVKW